jgi:hypothetical protein
LRRSPRIIILLGFGYALINQILINLQQTPINMTVPQKHFFIVPNDAHYYKILEMLKQFKIVNLFRHVSVHTETIIREQSCA